MELKEFITETLKQINDGLQDGSKFINSKKGLGVKKDYINLSFDIAVTTVQDESTSGGAKISVASILSAGGGKEKNLSSTNYSRIQFHVPIYIST
jgi:hypothetical protein